MAASRGRIGPILGVLAVSAIMGTIVVNALWMQAGPHPAPLMARKPVPEATKTAAETTGTLAAGPRVRPAEPPVAAQSEGAAPTPRPRPQSIEELQREIAAPERKTAAAPAAGPAAPRPRKIEAGPNPPATRVTAVQRALAEYGFGQIKPSGVIDEATRKAVEKFERERNLPVTGQVSPRLLRELAAVTGRPIN